MGAFLKRIEERNRREATGDKEFLQAAPPYAFELRAPKNLVVGPNAIIFQLPVGPEGFEMREPFSVTVEETVGGIHVVNVGIRQRRIKLNGWTAFQPRLIKMGSASMVRLEKRSFGRKVTDIIPRDAVSGLRQLQYLEDGLVRVVSDLKAEPETAAETQVIWHDLKHDEHWFVEIEDFSFTRERMFYKYSFQLLCLGSAEALKPELDTGPEGFLAVVATVQEVVAAVRDAAELVQAAVNEVLQVISEIKAFVADIEEAINAVLGIVDAAVAFVNGVVDFVSIGPAFVGQVLQDIADAGDTLDSLTGVSDVWVQSLKSVEDGLAAIAARREIFAPSADETAINLNGHTIAHRSTAELETASASAASRSLASAPEGPSQGDLVRQRLQPAERGVSFNGVRRIALTSTDSLQSLAALHLGDASLWALIASVNDLRPPYISATQAIGTVMRGAQILIPVRDRSAHSAAFAGVFGADPSASPEERALGVDLQLEQLADGQYDVTIDVGHGATDVALARGIPNLQQALDYRLNVIEGNDPIFGLGRRRTALDGAPDVRTAMELTLMSEAISADPRVVRVRTNSTELDGDALIADLTVEVRGLADGVTARGRV